MVSEEMIEYVRSAGDPSTVAYQLDYLEDVDRMGALLQLDRPIIRVLRDDGVQFATIDVPTGEVCFVEVPGDGA